MSRAKVLVKRLEKVPTSKQNMEGNNICDLFNEASIFLQTPFISNTNSNLLENVNFLTPRFQPKPRSNFDSKILTQIQKPFIRDDLTIGNSLTLIYRGS